MSRHSKLETLAELRAAGLVAIFDHTDIETARRIADALSIGGFRVLEFTNRGDHSIETFAGLERWLRANHPNSVLGVGSVVDAPSAIAFANRGADFCVGPATVEAVADACNQRQIPYIPGCGTLTEMLNANRLGCEVVKAFPAGALGGPEFVKSILAPCPWLQIMVTGGVTVDVHNLRAWFDAGVFAVGVGSSAVPSDLVAAGRWSDIQEIAQRATETMGAVR